MAAFIPVPNVCQLESFYTSGGQQMENVFHLQQDTPFDLSRLEDACTDLETWINANWHGVASEDISWVGARATSLESDSAPSFEPTIAEPVDGTITSPILPLNCAAVISWKTALRGRSYRGRTYHVGLTESTVDNSTINSTMRGGLVTAYLALLAVFVADDLQPVIVSRYHDLAPRTTGVATAITSLACDDTVDSQRRRLPGRGR